MESLLTNVTATMPEPQEHAIAGARAEAEAAAKAPPQAPTQARDRQGRSFDPELHETKEDGSAVINKDGSLRLKRGRGSERIKANSEIKTPEMARIEPSASKTGHLIAEQIFSMGRLVGGEEWAPVVNPEYGVDERAQMYEAWATYCEHKEIRDIPPGIALGMVMVAYVSPRMFMPKTKSRITKAKEWCITALVKLKLWKGRHNDTRSNSRDDGERKDDNSQAAG